MRADKVLTLGRGKVSFDLDAKDTGFPTITLGEFLDKDKERVVGECYIYDDVNRLLSLEFRDKDSLSVLKECISTIEDFFDAELEVFQELVEMDYMSTVLEVIDE